MQITIIKSKHKVSNVEDLKKDSKFVVFQVEAENFNREKAKMLFEKAYYVLFEKEKSDKLRVE